MLVSLGSSQGVGRTGSFWSLLEEDLLRVFAVSRGHLWSLAHGPFNRLQVITPASAGHHIVFSLPASFS